MCWGARTSRAIVFYEVCVRNRNFSWVAEWSQLKDVYAVLLKALVMSFVSEFILYMYLFERMFVFLLCIHSFEYVELSCMFAGNCQYLWLRVWMGGLESSNQ